MIDSKKFKAMLLLSKYDRKSLASEIGVSLNTITNITQGRVTNTKALHKICIALECTPNDIWDFKELEEKK